MNKQDKTFVIGLLFLLLGATSFFWMNFVSSYLNSIEIISIAVYILVLVLLVTYIGYFMLKKFLNLDSLLDKVINNYPNYITNDILIEYEKKARKIKIISPDLYDDLHGFYDIIKENIKNGKKYEYIIPLVPHVHSKMELLIDKLLADLKIKNISDLNLSYKAYPNFPFLHEYIIYDFPKKEIKGFLEINLKKDTTNIMLNNNQTHTLNNWFISEFRNINKE